MLCMKLLIGMWDYFQMRGCLIVQQAGMMRTLTVLMDTIEEFHYPDMATVLDPYQQRRALDRAV